MDGAAGPNGLPMHGHLNNAAMWTPPEGDSPRIEAFLFYELDKYPALDPVDDASVIYHEYTHGLVGRTVVDALGWGATELRQSWALNEALADFFSLDYLVGRDLIADTAAPGEVRLGAAPVRARRGPQGVDRLPGRRRCTPTARSRARPGRADLRRLRQRRRACPEPHYDGEIMGQTMWQLRGALLAAHGQAEGENRIRSLAYTALQLSPPEPSFLDYRNALLQADRVLRQGQDAERIWRCSASAGWAGTRPRSTRTTPTRIADRRPGPAGHHRRARSPASSPTATRGAPLAGAKVALGGHTTPNASDPGPVRHHDRRRRPLPLRARAGRHLPAPDRASAPATRPRCRRTSTCTARRAPTSACAATGPTRARARRSPAPTRSGSTAARRRTSPTAGRPPASATPLNGADERYVDIALPQRAARHLVRASTRRRAPTSAPTAAAAARCTDGARADAGPDRGRVRGRRAVKAAVATSSTTRTSTG